MQANKNKNYKIKDDEAMMYHVRLVQEIPTATAGKYITEGVVQIFSPRDFDLFLKNKRIFNFREEEIIHDPTLPMDVPVVEEVIEAKGEVKTRKGGYFGSPEWRAKQQAKKQS